MPDYVIRSLGALIAVLLFVPSMYYAIGSLSLPIVWVLMAGLFFAIGTIPVRHPMLRGIWMLSSFFALAIVGEAYGRATAESREYFWVIERFADVLYAIGVGGALALFAVGARGESGSAT